MERWRDGEMERGREGERERWRDGAMERSAFLFLSERFETKQKPPEEISGLGKEL